MTDFALLVIDVQMAFKIRDASGANRSCPQAEQNIGALMSVFRGSDRPIIHVHHHSLEEGSAFAVDHPGNHVQPFAEPQGDESVLIKHVNSSFIGTNLERDLNDLGRPTVIICGGTANHCVETTTRMAGNLGFDAIYVSDAVWAYDHVGPDGAMHSADQVHSMSLANLDGEFARVLATDAVLGLI